MNLKELLVQTKGHLLTLGYGPDGVDYIISELCRALQKLELSEEAAKSMDIGFPAFVHSRFGERQLRNFLRSIDPRTSYILISLSDSSEHWKPLEEWEMKEMDEEEIAEFNRIRKLLINESIRGTADGFKVFEDEYTYEALFSAHYRDSKKHLSKVDGHPGLLHPISTPFGGQPGFRRKLKRR